MPSNRVHDEIPDNLCFDWGWIEDNRAAVDAAMKARRMW
jgi:carbon-monoxide dehydrogenase large subunit